MVRIKFIAIVILTHSFTVAVSADVHFQGLGDLPGGGFDLSQFFGLGFMRVFPRYCSFLPPAYGAACIL